MNIRVGILTIYLFMAPLSFLSAQSILTIDILNLESNKGLDTNFLGIPKEGFGFSNDAMGRFGPKDFSEWLFEVTGDTQITMTTKYMN